MEVQIEIEGEIKAGAMLDRIKRRAASDAVWQAGLAPGMEEIKRFAMSVSPVLTGSYRASHRVAMAGKTATLSIDSLARNVKSGVPVTRYAMAVEEQHEVYAQTADVARRMAPRIAENVKREILK